MRSPQSRLPCELQPIELIELQAKPLALRKARARDCRSNDAHLAMVDHANELFAHRLDNLDRVLADVTCFCVIRRDFGTDRSKG
jgi:hypothetical protein